MASIKLGDGLVKEDISMTIDRGPVNASRKDSGAKQANRASIIGDIEHSDKRYFLDMTALIRSLQRAEGNVDCYRRDQVDCDQVECAWRPYCLENYNTSGQKENKKEGDSKPEKSP